MLVLPAPAGGRGERLGAVLDPAHRDPEAAGGRDDGEVLRVGRALGAERTARVGNDHADVGGVEAERARDARREAVRELVGAVDREAPVRPGLDEDRPRLQRRRREELLAQRHVHDGVRPRPGLLGDRRAEVLLQGEVVVAGVQRRVAPVPGVARGLRGGPAGAAVEVEDDGRGGVLGAVAVVGDDEGDRLPLVAHPIGGERAPERGVLGAEHRRGLADVGEVGGGEDRLDAGHGAGRRRVHAAQVGVRDRAAHERRLAAAVDPQVGDVAPASAGQSLVAAHLRGCLRLVRTNPSYDTNQGSTPIGAHGRAAHLVWRGGRGHRDHPATGVGAPGPGPASVGSPRPRRPPRPP